MTLFDKLRGRIKKQATDNEAAYWQLVDAIAADKDDSSPAAAEKVLDATGRTIEDLEQHVALVRERAALESTAANPADLSALNKAAGRALVEHDDKRKEFLLAWEKELDELNRTRNQTRAATKAADKANSRIAAINKELHPVEEAATTHIAPQLQEACNVAQQTLDEIDRQIAKCKETPENKDTKEALAKLENRRKGAAAALANAEAKMTQEVQR